MCARLIPPDAPPLPALPLRMFDKFNAACRRFLRSARCSPPVIYRLSVRKKGRRVVMQTEDYLGGLRQIQALVENSCRNPFPYRILVEKMVVDSFKD